MSLNFNEMDNDLSQIFADIGQEVTIHGEEVMGVVGNPNDEQLLLVGGDSDNNTITLTVRKSDFENLPEERDDVYTNSQYFTVKTIQNYPASSFLTLICETQKVSQRF